MATWSGHGWPLGVAMGGHLEWPWMATLVFIYTHLLSYVLQLHKQLHKLHVWLEKLVDVSAFALGGNNAGQLAKLGNRHSSKPFWDVKLGLLEDILIANCFISFY